MKHEQHPMAGGHSRRAEAWCCLRAGNHTEIELWEVVACGSLDAGCLVPWEMSKQVSWLLAPVVFVRKSLIVSLHLNKFGFPSFLGGSVWVEVSLSSLIPSTFQMTEQ